jgi:protoporphyrinogen/coproporphyrinogen III oxidase
MRNTQQPPVAILGAGIAGLTAARVLRQAGIPFVLYEAGKKIAGQATTFRDEDGFTYDFGAHFITNRLAREIGISDQCRNVRYYGESVVVGHHTYSYPFGLLAVPRYAASALGRRLSRKKRTDCASLAEWFRLTYGDTLAEEIAIPIAEAWSGAPASELAPSVGDKIPASIPRVLMLRLASKIMRKAVAVGYGREMPEDIHTWHVYPPKGLSSLCEHMASEMTQSIHLDCPAEAIFVEANQVVAVRVAGRDEPVSGVISTLPCTLLAKLLNGTHALDFLSRFRFRPMTFVMMKFLGRHLLSDSVVWTPEPRFPFFRLTETPISMPWLAPPGKTMITADIGCEVGDRFWTATPEELGQLCIESMRPILKDAAERYLDCKVLRTPIAYPVFLNEYEEDRKRFQQSTGIDYLYSLGRNGEFDHLLSEDVYWRTLRKTTEIAGELALCSEKLAARNSKHAVGMD